MNIRCPNCQTTFRVDPSRIPAAGVRARCSRCAATFQVTPDGAARIVGAAAPPAGGVAQPGGPASPPPAAPRPASPAPAASAAAPQSEPVVSPPAAAPQPGPPVSPVPRPPVVPQPRPEASPQPAAPQRSAVQPRPAASTAQPPVPPPTAVFGSRDPNARAQRIARALVSDIAAYHPKRRDECLAAGTLRTEFREEIMKSWEEYVAQVGEELAKSTPYFRNALNDILAKGQQLF